MKRILLIAQREFVATVSNRGFLIGLFIFPALIAALMLVGPRLIGAMRQPAVVGQIVVVDSTGRVVPILRSTLAPEAIEARRRANAVRTMRRIPGGAASEALVERAIGNVPRLTMVERPPDADLAAEKLLLSSDDAAARPLALVVIQTFRRRHGRCGFRCSSALAAPVRQSGSPPRYSRSGC